jgi:DNA-binding NarL/FixJ family response regulator
MSARDVLGASPAHPALRANLTPRELTVLELLADGLVAEAIGRRLSISTRTVNKHLEHVYRKLGTSDRLTSVLRARSLGILDAHRP